jgi:dihydrofolate reductase
MKRPGSTARGALSSVVGTVTGMGRIIFDTATTINGWIADEQNSLSWLFSVESGEHPDEGLFPANASVMVEGSTTYEWVLAQSDILAHPEKWAEFHGDRPTFVFTTRQLPVPEGADIRFVSGSVAEALTAIREAAGAGDIWIVGGGDLAGQFLDAGAVDEIALSVAPVALTGGAPLFPRRVESDRLRLVSAEKVGQFARLVYAVTPGTTATPAG